ncbi:MAG: nucleotidyl transferase AbiEii/AbiGii toxin family protein [Candidatus Delongbacteria bacterium]|nr:nucleotidyl transferase AbiEii/AbiGii toxin family protein [Candidatus Delongbacteria bacterium]
MHSAVMEMLKKYNCVNTDDYKNGLKEIIQEIALLGLYRSDFFNTAAFYGGSALRIFYGLNRFSEDLDFSLLEPDGNFDIGSFCEAIKDELGAYGFSMNVEKKIKSFDSNIESAFIKGNTKIQIMDISSEIPGIAKLHKNEKIRIKLEIDTNPPAEAGYEVKYQLIPVPYSVKLFDKPSLFSGKLHAILCRNWDGGRSKGRDLYDYLWYLSQNTEPNLKHLSERMKQTGHLKNGESITTGELKVILADKFETIDFKAMKADVEPFIKDKRELALWSKEFFISVTKDNL